MGRGKMRRSFLDDFSKKERLFGFLSDLWGRFSRQKGVRSAFSLTVSGYFSPLDIISPGVL